MKKHLKLLTIFFLIFTSCSMQKKAYDQINKNQIFWSKKDAQTPAFDEALTLDKAVDIAYKYNKQLLASNQQKDFAQGKILESLSNFLPSIEALGSYTYLEDHAKLKINNSSNKVGVRDNLAFTFQATQPIFTAGAIVSGYRASSFSSYITNENIKSQYQKLYFEVAKAYFDILLSEKLLDVQKTAFDNAKSHFEEVKMKEENGLASTYDLLRAEVEVTNFEAYVIKGKNKISLFKTKFLKLLGFSRESKFNLENLLKYQPFEIDEKEAMKTAYLSRPDFKAKSLEIDLQKQMVNIAKSDFFPKVYSTFAHRWGTQDANITTPVKWAKDWNVQVGFKWDILDFGNKRGKLKQQNSLLRQRRLLLKDITETISLEMQQAILNLEDANEFVKSQKLDLKRAKKALKLSELGYKEGIKTQIEVSDTITAMTRSQSLYYQAIYQYNLSILQLKLVMGALKESNKSITPP